MGPGSSVVVEEEEENSGGVARRLRAAGVRFGRGGESFEEEEEEREEGSASRREYRLEWNAATDLREMGVNARGNRVVEVEASRSICVEESEEEDCCEVPGSQTLVS